MLNKFSKKPMKRTLEKLTESDKMLIDFCRCLYQAKAIVRELKSFGDSVCPALNVYPEFIKTNNLLDSQHFIKQVIQYLDTTFQKFNRLCQILLMVLSEMEAKTRLGTCHSIVKKERIDSFRTEVWDEWKSATLIKQRLLHSIHSNTPPSETTDNHHPLSIKTPANNSMTTNMTTTTSTASETSNTTTTTTTTTTTRKSYIPSQCTSA